MQLNRDDHLEGQRYLYELIYDDGTRECTPALAHRRARDFGFFQIVPACPLCAEQAEVWAAAYATIEAEGQKRLVDGSSR